MKINLKTIHTLLASSALAMFLVVTGEQAMAAPTYCNAGSSHPDGIAVTDMTFSGDGIVLPDSTGNSADDCFGVVTKDDTSGGNDNAYDMNTIWDTGWVFLTKDDAPGGATDGSGTFGGFNFELTADAGTSGNWYLTATDPNGATDPNLPIYLDFIGVLKAADNFAAYFFDNVRVDGDDEGRWLIGYENCSLDKAGVEKCTPTPGLSHLSLYVRTGTPPDDGSGGGSGSAPEPGVLFLMGAGLVSLGLARRRKAA